MYTIPALHPFGFVRIDCYTKVAFEQLVTVSHKVPVIAAGKFLFT